MENSRNYGIDLLRIMSMIMVVMLHILGKGGVLNNAPMFSLNYEVAWLFEILCFCAVDCFAIVSGYVMCNSRVKFRNLFSLWFQVFFYSVLITFGFKLFTDVPVGLGNLFYSLFPVMFNQYWYFTAYFGMFLFLPFVNDWLFSVDKRCLKRFLAVAGIFLCIVPIVMQRDPFHIGWGYSSIWLLLMYIVGAYIRKFVRVECINKWKALAVYFGSCLFLWVNKFVVDFFILDVFPNAGEHGSAFIQYNSIFVVICAVSLFLFFLKLDVKNRFVICCIEWLAPVSFGVYLIYDQGLMSAYFIKDQFIGLLNGSVFGFILQLIGVVVCIYLICVCIDYVRLLLFKKLKIKDFSCRLENVVDCLMDLEM